MEEMRFCPECGGKLIVKELEGEGWVPFCPSCGQFRFPMYNVAVSMIVVEERSGRILLIQQYGRPSYILVAGYVNRGESAEQAVLRELKEETGLDAVRIQFNRTRFFEPSNTLMCNFTVFVEDAGGMRANREIDAYQWFSPEEAVRQIRPHSLAEEFLTAFLEKDEEMMRK